MQISLRLLELLVELFAFRGHLFELFLLLCLLCLGVAVLGLD